MQVIELFKQICSIPHCSKDAETMKRFLASSLETFGYALQTDIAGNILATHPDAKITLQAHYDMVCIGKAPRIELMEEDGWLSAKDSTLGADNGMAMAMMLALAQEGAAVDLLFTADEEVGLVGARNLEVGLKTPYLLNLDSEDEGIVTIGCAGGVDVIASMPITRSPISAHRYEYVVEGLPGGHSGVDIDKNIPNALKVLFDDVGKFPEITLHDISGGERRNAIAKGAKVVFSSDEVLSEQAGLKRLSSDATSAIDQSEKIITLVQNFKHGVLAFNRELDVVQSSVNLAQISSSDDSVEFHLSMRSMDPDALKQLEKKTRQYFEEYGCHVRSEGYYNPWQPETTPFGSMVTNAVEQFSGNASLGALHAGLECGIIKERYPDIDMVSIGPTIRYPHSTRECVELASVERVYATVKQILEKI